MVVRSAYFTLQCAQQHRVLAKSFICSGDSICYFESATHQSATPPATKKPSPESTLKAGDEKQNFQGGEESDFKGFVTPLELRWPKVWTQGLPAVLLVSYLLALFARFTYKGSLFLSFFTDDFFYYLVVARNLVLHGASTFNGIEATNGYHPLWLLTIALLYRVFGNHLSFFCALVLLIWLLVCGTYRALRRMQNLLGVAGTSGLACGLFSITFMAVISRTGMEVSLALFFLISLWQRLAAQPLEMQSAPEALFSGVLASAAVLSRLDISLIIAVYGSLTLFKPAGKQGITLRNLLWFSVGLAPVAIYLLINQFEFATLLPISGIAKNLKTTHLPSASTLKTLARPTSIGMLFTWPSLIIWVFAVLHFFRYRARTVEEQSLGCRRVQLCVLLHPLLFYGVLSFTSDWPLWTWYLYPLVPIVALFGQSTLAHWNPLKQPTVLRGLTAAITVALIGIMMNLARPNPLALPIYEQAISLAEFAKSHPGRYAMGDAAGTPAYLMPSPVLQLEGLMGDKPFLDRIRRQEPLEQALRELGVDYYISTHAKPNGFCYDTREPAEAGPHSPVMRAHVCSKPLAIFRPHGGTDTLVFDVHAFPSVADQEPR